MSMDTYPNNKIFTRRTHQKHCKWIQGLKSGNSVSSFMVQCEKRQTFFYWFVQYCNKKVEFKFMKEIKPDYLSMPEMVAELNAKIPAEPKTINLHLDGFNISHGASIKMEGSDLAMWFGFKENEILCGPTPCISVYGKYGTIYNIICQYSYHSESVSRWCKSIPYSVKSIYGDKTCVTYEQS